jgi:hypothetical protein
MVAIFCVNLSVIANKPVFWRFCKLLIINPLKKMTWFEERKMGIFGLKIPHFWQKKHVFFIAKPYIYES